MFASEITYLAVLMRLCTILDHLLGVPKGIRPDDQQVAQVILHARGQVANVGPRYSPRALLRVQNYSEAIALRVTPAGGK